MPRSSYIYVVDVPHGGPLVAAFTVKHELISWLRQSRSDVLWSLYRVRRVPDGGAGDPVFMPRAELLGEVPDA